MAHVVLWVIQGSGQATCLSLCVACTRQPHSPQLCLPIQTLTLQCSPAIDIQEPGLIRVFVRLRVRTLKT
jgi:hypothetical protein